MSEYNQRNIQIAKLVHDHWPYHKETKDHVSIIWILQCNSKATPVEFWTERWGIRQRVRGRLRCEGEWSFSQLLKPRSMFLTLILLQVGSGSKVRSNGSFRRGESPDQSRADRWVVFANILLWIRADWQVGEAPLWNVLFPYGHCPKGDGGVKACQDG